MTHPYTREYFEDGTISNYRGYKNDPMFKDRARWVKENYKPATVLEVGCAYGFFVKALLSLGVDAQGVDISEYAAEKSPVPDNVMVHDSTQPHPWLPQSFDLVVSFDVLEHIPESKIDAMIADMARVGKYQFHMITTSEHAVGGDHTHCTMHTKDWWLEKFKNYPATIIHAGEQPW